MIHPREIVFEERSVGDRIYMRASYQDISHDFETQEDILGSRSAVNGYRYYIASTLGRSILDDYIRKYYTRLRHRKPRRRRLRSQLDGPTQLILTNPEVVEEMILLFTEHDWYQQIGELNG